MNISEIFVSRQGEGFLVGTNSVFLRTSGCNLRCSFCDTPFTSWNPDGKNVPQKDVVFQVLSYEVEHVVITGGEPMLAPEIESLTQQLAKHHKHLTIETAGTIYREVACDLMSISPKLSNSTPSVERAGAWAQRHEKTRIQLDVLRQLIARFPYQLKFVVAEPHDREEIELLLAQIGNVDRDRVLLMPEGIDVPTLKAREEWLKPLAEAAGFSFCPRQHIEWYGNRRGT
ncbi:MAG: 7-carboxy-7-deazaguanine synthase QueE [Pirellulaceae bacterium]